MSSEAKNICLFGPQGSGKGTQAEKLMEHFGVPHISTGNIFRQAIADKTPLGVEANSYMTKGELVPDELTDKLVAERLSQENCLDGFVLDGYPRNPQQAEQLDGMTSLTQVVLIAIPDDVSVNRISRRRVAVDSGMSYHLDFKPPAVEGICDVSGEELVQRDDDKPEAIEKRLAIYHGETEPLIARYEERGIVHRIDGTQSIDKVWEDVQAIFA